MGERQRRAAITVHVTQHSYVSPRSGILFNRPIKNFNKAVHFLYFLYFRKSLLIFPTMRIQLQVDNVPYEIWDRIAFYTVASDEAFLGPPSNICSLALISRSIHQQISYKTNTNLYARIFRFKFDYAAPTRRLSERWRTTGCLASELIKRFKALKRIKSTEYDTDDLWTIYLMCVPYPWHSLNFTDIPVRMIENDGRNESQLLDYAGLHQYLQSLVLYQTTSPQAQELGWFRNPVVDSLLIWLLWLTSSEGVLKI